VDLCSNYSSISDRTHRLFNHPQDDGSETSWLENIHENYFVFYSWLRAINVTVIRSWIYFFNTFSRLYLDNSRRKRNFYHKKGER
jgi:hypothetical protein